jgi:hypothetical protein
VARDARAVAARAVEADAKCGPSSNLLLPLRIPIARVQRPAGRRPLLDARELAWLTTALPETAAAGDIPTSPPAAMLAFEIDALLSAANVDRNLSDDTRPLEIARKLIALRSAAGGLPHVQAGSPNRQ